MFFYIDNSDLTNPNIIHDVYRILNQLNIPLFYNSSANTIKIYNLLIGHIRTPYPIFIVHDLKGSIINKKCYSINEVVECCKCYIKLYNSSHFVFY